MVKYVKEIWKLWGRYIPSRVWRTGERIIRQKVGEKQKNLSFDTFFPFLTPDSILVSDLCDAP